MFKEQVVSLISTINVSEATLSSEKSSQVTEGTKDLILNSSDGSDEMPTIKRTEPKIGRNDPCFCGSGKKYKNCHGK